MTHWLYSVLINHPQNVNQPTIHIQLTPDKEPRRLMPEKKERDLWWAYLAGKPETDWNPPKKPKQSPRLSKHRRGMRGFSDDVGSYERHQQEAWQINDEGEVGKISRAGPMESLPTPSCSPAPPDTSSSREDQVIGPSSMIAGVLPQRTTILTPREPMPCLLKHIDQVSAFTMHVNGMMFMFFKFYQRMALHLLMYFAHWFNLYLQQPDPAARPLEAHARWIFALLSKVEDDISADDMSLLRNLARACIGLLKESIKTRTSAVKSEDVESLKLEGDDKEIMSERACWIIVCTVVGVWAQRDLWMDAEDMLKTL